MKAFTATLAFILLCSPLLRAKNNKSPAQLHFLENKGQVTDQYHNQRTDIDFKISSGALNVFIGNGKLHYQFHKPGLAAISKNITTDAGPIPTYRMDVVLQNANKNAQIITEDNQPYYEQHYRSVTPVTAHSFRKITYKNIYPSIDWVLYIKDNQLEYDFVIHKGGNPADIKLQYNGATSLALNKDGGLTANTPMGTITEKAPYSYQQDGKQIASSFVLNSNILNFKTAPYKEELVIDPKLIWSTYYGGGSSDYTGSVACDDSGNVYIAGGTGSTNNIATTGSHQATFSGGEDAFLAKFNTSGERIWSTYYGGSGIESDIVVACDKFYNVFLTGSTQSTSNISTVNSHQDTKANNDDAFLVKFNSLGERQWATYYGGDSVEHGQAVCCDDSGNVYICGVTSSITNISTIGSYQPVYANTGTGGGGDAFLAKFDSSGVRQWGTYYGGIGGEWGFGIATDATCKVYITGETSGSTNMAGIGAHQPISGGDYDAFLAKFDNSGERIWGTYYGGTGSDYGYSLALQSDELYLSGTTTSAADISTPGSHQSVLTGIQDAYLVKFDTAGHRIWGTYYGGSNGEMLQGWNAVSIAIGNNSSIYISYATSSTDSVATTPVPQEKYGGGQIDVFLAKLNNTGVREWGTYFGSCNQDIDGGCATDNNGNVYIVGYTNNDYMATSGSYQETKDGSYDAFLAKFNDELFSLSGDTGICAGSTTTYYASFVPGAESYTWTLPNGWMGSSTVDTINATAGTTSGTVSVVANKSCSTEPPQELFVTVHLLPVPLLNLSNGALSVAGTYVSYQWHNTAGPIAGATAPTYTPTDPNEYYYVVVTDTNGCVGQSGTINLLVGKISDYNNITLYPNPNYGSFTLSVTGLPGDEEVAISIIDVTGRLIWSGTANVRNNVIKQNIDLEKSLATGMYLLKLNAGNYSVTKMFHKN